MKYGFIREWHSEYPVTVLCRVMQVSPSAYYDWRGHGGELIDSETRCSNSSLRSVSDTGPDASSHAHVSEGQNPIPG